MLGADAADVAVYTIRGLVDLADMAASKGDTATQRWADSHAAAMEQRFRLEKSQRQILERCHRRCENVSATVRHYDARRRLMAVRQGLEAQVTNLAAAAHTRLLECRGALERQTASLDALSPVAILNRGYALVFDAQGQLVKDAVRLKAGDEVSARLARGRIRARVTATERSDPKSGGAALE